MSFWDSLFDNEVRQRRDINFLQAESEGTTVEVGALREENRRLAERVDQLELMVEGLVTVLEAHKLLRPRELALAIQRLDLADGYEDGRIGPDRSDDAPTCGSCARPVNPKRQSCLYCGAELRAEDRRPKPKPPRMTACERCGAQVAERSTWITELGVVCHTCYLNPGQAGALSVAPPHAQGGGMSLSGEAGSLSGVE